MKFLIFWILLAGTLYCIVRSLIADIRLCQERRDGAPAWTVWLSPSRHFSASVYTEAGERARRDALRSTGWALLLGLGAAVRSALELTPRPAEWR
jgi:hypothetical protein